MDNGNIRYLHFIKKDMKKIVLIIVFALLSVWAFGQARPQDIKVNRLWCNTMYLLTPLVGTSDSVLVEENGRIKYVLATNLSGASLWKLTGDKLEPKISTNYINTDSSYYLKGIEFIKANHNLGNQFIGVGSGANNIVDSINDPKYGYLGLLNTANGYYSLYSNTYGGGNIANGAQSLYSNTTGNHNVANGYQSLYSNTTGNSNIANGAYSLYSNTTGNYNIANGAYSLYSNTTSYNNIANGFRSLYSNTTGGENIANGYQSLYSNTTGSNNIANGAYSLYSNTTGYNNIAIGYKSGQYADTAANGLLWIGEGDYKNAIIYGNMVTDSLRLNANVNVGTNLMVNQSATIGTNLTVNQSATIGTDLTVHGEIINGGLINKDTVITLIDDATFNFPKTSVGWAEIQCDSSLIEKTWGVVSWNGDGSTSLRSNGAKFVNTDIDGNYACFYNNGSVAYLKNTSGYTQTYSIKYHYHN
jgi:hypothetical protein